MKDRTQAEDEIKKAERKALGGGRLPLNADWRNDRWMADRSKQVSTNGLVDTKRQSGATKRRQYSEALKREMVAETQVPGASVSSSPLVAG